MAPTQNSKTEKKTKNEQNDDKVEDKQRELLVTIFSTLDIPSDPLELNILNCKTCPQYFVCQK